MAVTDIVKDINRLAEPAKTACKLFMSEATKRNIPIFITETLRTAERQKYLFNKGVSQLDGYKKKGNHQSGMAWDIACQKPNQLYDNNILARAGALAKELGITWGGDWKDFVDKPHFEVTKNWKKPDLGPKIEKVKVKVNGVVKTVDAINKGGHYYNKLRDLEDSKIKVDFANGKVLINGVAYVGETINVDGNNFIKLRDLPATIDVYFDKSLNMPVITSK